MQSSRAGPGWDPPETPAPIRVGDENRPGPTCIAFPQWVSRFEHVTMDTPSPSQRQLLEKVFTTALDRGFDPERAETYGVWILCFARYCAAHDIEPPAAAQVPNFMAYLAGRPDLSVEERDRALDAVLFAITEVSDAFASGAPPERTLPARSSTGADASPSGFQQSRGSTAGGQALTHLLLDTDIQLYDAVRLKISDVDRDAGVPHTGAGSDREAVLLTDRLRADVGAAARQALRRGSVYLFPDAHAKYVGDEPPELKTQEPPAPTASAQKSTPGESARAESPRQETSTQEPERRDESTGDDSDADDDRVRSIFPSSLE